MPYKTPSILCSNFYKHPEFDAIKKKIDVLFKKNHKK